MPIADCSIHQHQRDWSMRRAATWLALTAALGCDMSTGKWTVETSYDPIDDHNFSSIELQSDSGNAGGGSIRLYCMVGPRLVVDWRIDSMSKQELDTLYNARIRFDDDTPVGPYDLPAHSEYVTFDRHSIEADTIRAYWESTTTDSILLADLPEAESLVLRFYTSQTGLESILSRDIFWDVRGYKDAFKKLKGCDPR